MSQSTGSHVIDGDIRVLEEMVAESVSALAKSRHQVYRLEKGNARTKLRIRALLSAVDGRFDEASCSLLQEVLVRCCRDERILGTEEAQCTGALHSAIKGRCLSEDSQHVLEGLVVRFEADIEANLGEIKILEGGQKGHYRRLKTLERVILAVRHAEASLG